MEPGPWFLDRRVFYVIFAGSVAATAVAGRAAYVNETLELKLAATGQIEAISKLREGEVTRWRSESLRTVEAIAGSLQWSDSLAAYLQSPAGSPAPAGMQEWFDRLVQRGPNDRAFLLDGSGTTRLAAPRESAAADPLMSRQAREVLSIGGTTWLDFYLVEGDPQPHLATIGAIPGRPGALVLGIDPDQALPGLLAGWPTLSTTGETLLVRRDGTDVVFLNRLRFHPAPPLTHRVPLTDTRVLAVKAALGETGAVEGLDYRGHAVAGYIQPIPGTPWRLVTRMDLAEINAAAFERMGAVVAFAVTFLFGVFATLGWLWRDQRARYYKRHARLFTALQESEERLRLAMASANQGMFDLDIPSGAAIVSPEYATMLGYEPALFRETHQSWLARLHPDDRERVGTTYRNYVEGRADEYRVEFRLRTADGSWRWILSHGRVVSWSADGQPLRMLGTHTDINLRKLAEIKSVRLAQLYAALSHCSEAIVRASSEDELFPQACRDAVTVQGLQLAWIGLIDGDGRTVNPVAAAGKGLSHLDDLQLGFGPDNASGEGPIGLAIRTATAVWSDDVGPAAEAGARRTGTPRYGCTSVGAIPLKRHGRVVGILGLCADPDGAFDAEVRSLLVEMAAAISFALDMFARGQQRSDALAALQNSLYEKDALLKEVHHRVKNNLQVVTSLLRLESGRSDEPAVKQALAEMQSRVMSMALLHETLYRSGNLAAIDLSVYLTRLANQVFRSMATPSGSVTLRLNLTPRLVDLDQAVACGLLVNELISNSLKHAFPDGRRGEVRVEVDSSDGGRAVRLRVADSGIGLPPDLAERRQRSLGLQLVGDLVTQLQGTLDFDGGPGACCTVVFVPKASSATR